MPTFTHRVHSALARCSEDKGVLCVEYSGLITPRIFAQLDAMLGPARARTVGAFENISNAITLPQEPHLCKSAWLRSTPVSIVIVRDDQWETWVTYYRRVWEETGVFRAVFFQHQFEEALAFARRIFPYTAEGFFPHVRVAETPAA
jgi:hypothetical protein